MTERYLFFNSTMNDRRRNQASDMAEYWKSFLSSGLIHQDGEPKLKVIANDLNRNIRIDYGRAVIHGHAYLNLEEDGELIHRIDDPDSVLDRIDRVVVRYDNSIENRHIKSFIIKGIEAENPESPALTREGDVYELSLAQIRVVAGQSYISQEDVTDERLDESVCGLASSLVGVPTDIFMQEWQEWFSKQQTEGFVLQRENNIFSLLNTTYSRLNILLNDETLMNETTKKPLTMEWVMNSDIIQAEILKTDMALAKHIAALANLNPENYEDIKSLVKDQVAMEEIANNEKPIKFLARSETAVDELINSEIGVESILNSKIGMEVMTPKTPFLSTILKTDYAENLWSSENSKYIWLKGGDRTPPYKIANTEVEVGTGGYSGGATIKMISTAAYGNWTIGFTIYLDLTNINLLSFYDKGRANTRRVRINDEISLSGSISSTWTKRTLDVSDYNGLTKIGFGYYNPTSNDYLDFSDLTLGVN